MTLMYPLDDRIGGPPYSLSEDIYHGLLDAYFVLQCVEDCPSPPKRQGREKIAIWLRK